MGKILGLDLGTNSIGWAIRDTSKFEGSQIIDKGVLIFKSGVGEGESREQSLAAERRKNRSRRRLYNARRYRKWELLKVLIENDMCPLKKEELDKWRIGEFKIIDGKKKNTGRKYPLSDEFISWLRMDFNNDNKQDYLNPYRLRCELVENNLENDIFKKYKIGRALYHLVQRRGFKSSKKLGVSSYGENELFKKFRKKYPDKKDWTPAQIYLYLQSKQDDEIKLDRIRNSGILQRDEYEKEFFKICKTQNIDENLTKKLHNAIYYVRPLRSQKSLVGKCTLEPNKTRIPISHPLFEEFRALQFINNIKYNYKDSKEEYFLSLEQKKEIFKKFFFRESKPIFKFEEISKYLSKNGDLKFNFKNNLHISACPITAKLMNFFDEKWKEKFINNGKSFGINWDGLTIEYETKSYGKNKKVKLDYDGIWHILYYYLQINEKSSELEMFAKDKLNLDYDKAKEFSEIEIKQGYASLSKKAIKKIIPYLRKGLKYNEAVIFAKIPDILGYKYYESRKEEIENDVIETIKKNQEERFKLYIINSLISKFYTLLYDKRKEFQDQIFTDDNFIKEKIINIIGKTEWDNLSDTKKGDYINYIRDKFKLFIEGKQDNEEKVSYKEHEKTPKRDYYKLPRADEAVKKLLKEKYNVEKNKLEKLYHHSDIDIYPKFEKKLGDPMPPSKGFKNPMAMRALHQLKHLINYLIEVNKIDENTRIVIELARELNDTNYRIAYEKWIRDKEKENIEFRKIITEFFETNANDEDLKKFKLAVEQLVNDDCKSENFSKYKKKYENFINEYLISNNDDDTSFDYTMYLILYRDEFFKMLNYELPESKKWVMQIIKKSSKIREKRKELANMMINYKLWKEQKFQCIYTGRIIPLKELFGSTKYQMDHIVPRSISFNNELENFTICDATYNKDTKSKKFPSECPNFNSHEVCKTISGEQECSPINERIKKLIKPKVTDLENRINDLKKEAKKIPDWEIDKKNANIRLRHYLNFELDYWKKKLFYFTVKKDEWKDSFKNSQLVDTQIISKYAKSYLKALFKRVDVIKGAITSIYREIYNTPPKNRDKHSHHAIDACILTLIPESATREKELKEYFESKEDKNINYIPPIPYENFDVKHISDDIEDNILINHITNDRTLDQTRKYARKRGKIIYLKDRKTGEYITDENGNRIKMVLEGDTIRGRLHKETFLGAIKVNERNEDGYPIKENGKFVVLNENGKDVIWIVSRKKINEIDFEKDEIVDKLLKKHIEKQLEKGVKKTDLLDLNGNKIRHIRCRYKAGRGFLTDEKAYKLKEHIFLSKLKHKQKFLVQNDENYLFLLYENIDNNGDIVRDFRIMTLLDLVNYNIKHIDDIYKLNEFNNFSKKKNKNTIKLNLKNIFKVGDRLILYNDIKEINEKNFIQRLYRIYKFNTTGYGHGTGYLYLQHHLEARDANSIENLEESRFNPNDYQPLLKISYKNINCLKENIDFKINIDSSIRWMNNNLKI